MVIITRRRSSRILSSKKKSDTPAQKVLSKPKRPPLAPLDKNSVKNNRGKKSAKSTGKVKHVRHDGYNKNGNVESKVEKESKVRLFILSIWNSLTSHLLLAKSQGNLHFSLIISSQQKGNIPLIKERKRSLKERSKPQCFNETGISSDEDTVESKSLDEQDNIEIPENIKNSASLFKEKQSKWKLQVLMDHPAHAFSHVTDNESSDTREIQGTKLYYTSSAEKNEEDSKPFLYEAGSGSAWICDIARDY